jgi:argininosuccinate lyase
MKKPNRPPSSSQHSLRLKYSDTGGFQSDTGTKPWGGRFQEPTNRLVERFTASVAFDSRLYAYDIEGSIAHCKTLLRAKIISKKECTSLINGLKQVRDEIQAGRHEWKTEDEDVHMSIERRLTQIVGPVGGKLHTGRSRNDQVTLDLRLYLRDTVIHLEQDLTRLQLAFLALAKRNKDVIMPGYTHLQRAQPVLFAHHAMAYMEMLERDKGRLRDAYTRINVMPLGSGALAGTNYPLDRAYTAALLNFPLVTQNSLDGVSDRDYVLEVLSACAIIMMHLSRLSEELILWSSQEFHFAELSDGFCTGSSMMPQKKNPDIPELVRGKTGRIYGHLISVLTTLKGLPLSYNRDLQEDKEPLFDSLETISATVHIYTELIEQLTISGDAMTTAAGEGFLLATELADYLVLKGVPFRDSHHIVGSLVRECLAKGKEFSQLSAEDLQQASPAFDAEAFGVLTPEAAVKRKNIIGGTAPAQVDLQLKRWGKLLTAETKKFPKRKESHP